MPNCDTMKGAIVFVLLFASVLCRPARKPSSSSESSEEVMRPAPAIRTPQIRAALQNYMAADATGEISGIPDEATEATTDTAPVSDDDDDEVEKDEEKDSEEEDEHENDTTDSSESEEASTLSPVTVPVVTEEPTPESITANVVIDQGRGDSSFPSEYKSIYVEDKSYQKGPSSYKSYDVADAGKKTAPHDMTDGNEVEKTLKVYKVQALQVHDLLEEDTSTPEEESQGIDTSFSSHDPQEASPRQASLPEPERHGESASASSSTTTEDQSTSDASNSASQESQDADVQSSEEATDTPGAADSDSDEAESAESKEAVGPDATTDIPPVITAKK